MKINKSIKAVSLITSFVFMLATVAHSAPIHQITKKDNLAPHLDIRVDKGADLTYEVRDRTISGMHTAWHIWRLKRKNIPKRRKHLNALKRKTNSRARKIIEIWNDLLDQIPESKSQKDPYEKEEKALELLPKAIDIVELGKEFEVIYYNSEETRVTDVLRYKLKTMRSFTRGKKEIWVEKNIEWEVPVEDFNTVDPITKDWLKGQSELVRGKQYVSGIKLIDIVGKEDNHAGFYFHQARKIIERWWHSEPVFHDGIEVERGVPRREVDRAKEYFLKALNLRPFDVEIMTSFAEFLSIMDPDLAEHYFGQAIIMQPDNPIWYLKRGQFYYQRGLWKFAIGDFTSAILQGSSSSPGFSPAFLARAEAFLELRGLKPNKTIARYVISDIERFFETNFYFGDERDQVDYAKAYYIRARAYHFIGERDLMLNDYREAAKKGSREAINSLDYDVETFDETDPSTWGFEIEKVKPDPRRRLDIDSQIISHQYYLAA